MARTIDDAERQLDEAERRANAAVTEATGNLAAREQHRRDRALVHKAIKDALKREVLAAGGTPATLTEEIAKAIVVALAMKKIPHVSITY